MLLIYIRNVCTRACALYYALSRWFLKEIVNTTTATMSTSNFKTNIMRLLHSRGFYKYYNLRNMYINLMFGLHNYVVSIFASVNVQLWYSVKQTRPAEEPSSQIIFFSKYNYDCRSSDFIGHKLSLIHI